MSEAPNQRAASTPEARAVRAEIRSTQALTIPFVGREREMSDALDHLVSEEPRIPHQGRSVVLHGDSGTGKTFFTREMLRRVYTERPNALFLYVDIANDEYQGARTIGALLKLALVAGPMTGTSRISVPDTLSLYRYRRKTRQRGVGRGFFRGLVQSIASAVGVGAVARTVLEANSGVEVLQVEDELAGYLAWVAKRQDVFLAIDNLQFLNLEVRLTLESVIQRAGERVRFLALDRTTNGVSELNPPVRCFSDSMLDLWLGVLTADETMEVVSGAIAGDTDTILRLAADIYTKTGGLAKDIEYCLRQYAMELGRGAQAGAIDGLLSTIDRLPLIHRQFLVIAALLDGGVQQAIARGTVSRLTSAYDRARLDEVVDELIARDYLRLNGENGDRLRPGHERIVISIRDLADDELHDEVRLSLVAELTAALEEPLTDGSESYLLHCLIGLQTAQELARNIHYISRLIQSQHRQDQFSYLVAISDELHDILPLLPGHVLNDLLDAMQKSSAFEKGLELVTLLDAHNVPGSNERRIHRLKFLTQAYRYEEALALAAEIDDADDRSAVYRINLLMAVDRDDEARDIAERHLTDARSEYQAVLRRNTITLYDVDTALRHLDEAYLYFERDQSYFRLATVDTNRSTIYIQAGRYGDAGRCLDRAVERMRFVESREIFQAQLNVAVRAALLGDFATALESVDLAALQVPRALLFDQVKIEINRIVIRCASGVISRGEAEAALVACAMRVRGYQMPYLHEFAAANVAAAKGAPLLRSSRPSDRVGFNVPFPAQGSTWELGLSVHWRY
jgi:tetratricopeptide (TPR) repeat protein